MLRLRKIIRGIFGFLFLISAASLAGIIVGISRVSNSPRFAGAHAGSAAIMLASAIAICFCTIFGMAWWSVKTAGRFTRGWAMAASSLMIGIGGLFFLSILMAMASPTARTARIQAGNWFELVAINLILFVGGGIGGIIAFSGYDQKAESASRTKAPRIAGDGTSGLVDFIAVGLSIAGYFYGENLWIHWAGKQGLPLVHGAIIWLLLLLAVLADVLFHEIGHASIGMLLGMKLRAFIVGPFQFRVRDGRWRFQFLLSKAFNGGGAAALVPTDPAQPLWCDIAMIAAGPIFSLMTGLAGAVATQSVVGTVYAANWQFFAFLSTFGFISFIVNLLPLRPDALYSDGARIYQLLSGGQWRDLHRAMQIPAATTVTPLRARNYDIAAIERSSKWLARGKQALLLRLLATSYYFDSSRPAEALVPLAEAERIYDESASDIPADLHTAFVFDTAFLRRDSAAARKWWTLMEAKKPTHFGVDYWLSKSALLWIEGRFTEADEAWRRGYSLAAKLPAAGCYEFDRFRYAELRGAIDGVMSAPLVQSHAIDEQRQGGHAFAPVLD